MTHQIIKSPDGADAYVLVPVEEWRDILDAREGARILDRMQAGEVPAIPHDVVKRIALGEATPLRAIRQWRGLTQPALAEAASISQAYLSAIERGDKAGSVAAWKAIAAALGVTMDDLVP